MSSFTPFSENLYSNALDALPVQTDEVGDRIRLSRLLFAAAAFLVSVPVFLQAPLVRAFPWLSLVMTGGWFGLSLYLRNRNATALWGDLMLGFTWTWLAGSVYWGWLRWEPLLHLPIESIGLPFAWLSLMMGRDKIGNWFYLGSLFGTSVTDIYFYLVNLIPQWRQLMQVEPDLVQPIFQSAVMQIQTPWGGGCAIALALVLIVASSLPLRLHQLHWWGFSGAVFSTILVDGLFWVVATHA
ncbi:MAG: DUF3120 domain-containing protein [Oscillatoriophycideae cyanobacterium NC_groundwater_1537_Pr4_S-0.65um_50_18]|nr:DUF3120 domain-containing protein [Oscillatoriophycideae cyanobacterium NC_groundwater_1537_Pr4_S-0.65um_50_18]